VSSQPAPAGATVVGVPSADRTFVWVLFPILGAGAGWLLKIVAHWLALVPWGKVRRPMEFIESLPEPQATIGCVVVGAVAGVVLVLLAEHDYVTVAVDNEQVRITHAGTSTGLPRNAISAVYLDKKKLVFCDPEGDELTRQGGELPNAERLGAALLAHGYPWRSTGASGELTTGGLGDGP